MKWKLEKVDDKNHGKKVQKEGDTIKDALVNSRQLSPWFRFKRAK